MPKLATAKPRTLDEKIALTRALLAKYIREKNLIATIEAVEIGDVVSFKFGRSNTARLLKGSITGVRDTPTGKYVAIISGEGFDTVTLKVRIQDITHNETADRRKRGVVT